MFAENDVPRLFAAQSQPVFLHRFQHITVADGGDHDLAADPPHRLMQSEITHDGRHQGVVPQRLLPDQFMGQNHHDLVAVHQPSLLVHGQTAVSVAIESQAQVGLPFQHSRLQRFHVGGPTVIVDIQAVRRAVQDLGVHSQPGQNRRCSFAGGAVGAVNDDPQAGQGFLDRTAEKILVFRNPVVSITDRSHGFPRRPGQCLHAAGHDFLQFVLDRIGQFVARAAEKFDTVVAEWIVRSGNDDAGCGVGTAGEPSDARSGNHAEDRGIAAGRTDSGAQRRFQHLSRNAGVPADQKCRFFLFPAKIPGRGPTQAERQLRRQFSVGDAPDSICAKQSCH